MSRESEKTNPYASPAPQQDLGFRDLLKQERDKASQERSRRAAICMSIGCAGIIIAMLLINSSGTAYSRPALVASGHVLNFISITTFFFGSLLWSWIQPIHK